MAAESNAIGAPKKKSNENYSALAYRLKKQMDDIITTAYGADHALIKKYKNFHISCLMKDMKTRLGDSQTDRFSGASEIRLFSLGKEDYKSLLITAMHEVSHHIDHQMRNKSGHDAAFYEIHKALLFASFDMGILTRNDVTNSTSSAQNRDKLAKMMLQYVPHPVEYKKDKASVHVYNCYDVKEQIKGKGYHWNAIDKSWVLDEIDQDGIEEEKAFLIGLGLKEENIRIVNGGAVISRLRKNVRLYDVPYESREIPKKLGFKWNADGKYWEKKIEGERLPQSEWEQLKKMSVMRIEIT